MLSYLKSIFLIAFIVSEGQLLIAQKITPFSSWDAHDLRKANSAKNIKDLSFQEKKVIFYINLARMDGELFAETYLKDYMDDVRIPKNKYYRSLIAMLKEQEGMEPLEPKNDLISEAIKHSKEMGRVGKKGHRSADAKSFSERMEKFKSQYNKIKESNQYGYPDALSIVVDLLIDDDQESLRHRKMLLDPELKFIGVGIRNHKKFRINTSVLLAN
tara:strand:+ start:2818 stop:3462 length:645 start_codon:yes stop_codon:yes gene_type:complete